MDRWCPSGEFVRFSFDKFHSSLELSEEAITCMGLKIIFKIDIIGIRIKDLLVKN